MAKSLDALESPKRARVDQPTTQWSDGELSVEELVSKIGGLGLVR